ncbi:hypothetical protein [Coxiella-like endosymbiont]|nr:hypothetical protein [Coxiella-like endosymbiont]
MELSDSELEKGLENESSDDWSDREEELDFSKGKNGKEKSSGS